MTEITEEMVEAARDAYEDFAGEIASRQALRLALTAAFASRPSQDEEWAGKPTNFAGWKEHLLLLTDQISNGEIADAGATIEEMLEGFDDVAETEVALSAAPMDRQDAATWLRGWVRRREGKWITWRSAFAAIDQLTEALTKD